MSNRVYALAGLTARAVHVDERNHWLSGFVIQSMTRIANGSYEDADLRLMMAAVRTNHVCLSLARMA